MTLKFFRKYNKFILAGGGTLLMIAFLIQPFMNQFGPNPANAAIGFIDGQKITRSDVLAAGYGVVLFPEGTSTQGYEVARLVGLNLIARLKAELGDLDRVVRILKVVGMVNSAPDFT